MASGGRFAWMAAALIAGAPSGCSSKTPEDASSEPQLEAGSDGDDGRVDANNDEGTFEADVPGRGGPATLVVSELAVTEERLCDHDGDGILDNALAELGSPGSGLLSMALSTFIRGTLNEGGNRIMIHAPWVDDIETPNDPDLLLIVFNGLDIDDPRYGADDFSGEEPFLVTASHLDPCGEPTRILEGNTVDRGRVDGGNGTIPTPLGAYVPGHGGHATGTLEPYAAGGELELCFYVLARELGAADAELGGLSYLEVFLAGGAILGLPTLPGLTPDLDLDGDGLERFTVDSEGQLESCIDGDLTVIDGRDCWQDPRMADGIALSLSLSAVPAVLEGREEDWEQWATGTCGGTFLCEHGCSGMCLCDPPCAEVAESLESLEACLDVECVDECGPDSQRIICWRCGESRCVEELDACLASDCCPSPPEQSLWDAS